MPKANGTVWLITNHAPARILSDYGQIKGDVIAVDSGLEKVHELGLEPTLVIGDFDSLDPTLLQKYPNLPRLQFNSHKNETDTELALNECAERGYRDIVICNDMQGRWDHSAAIIQNLIALHDDGISCRIDSGRQMIWFLSSENRIKGRQGDLLSLIAYSPDARFEESLSLEYPLAGLLLQQHQSRGISNIFTADEVLIRLARGLVLAIHSPCHILEPNL